MFVYYIVSFFSPVNLVSILLFNKLVQPEELKESRVGNSLLLLLNMLKPQLPMCSYWGVGGGWEVFRSGG